MKAKRGNSLPAGARPVNAALALALLLAALAPWSARAEEPALAAPPDPVRLRLVPDRTAAAPGETIRLSLIVAMEEGWHVYWNGRNDTGFPLAFELDLPEGCTAGAPEWPAPERHADESGTLDHVYAEPVAIFIPVTLSPFRPAADSLVVRCRVTYAVCRDICLLGEEEVAAGWAVSRSAASRRRLTLPEAEAGIVARSLSRVPVPLRKARVPLAARWEGDTLVLRSRDAGGLAFYPGPECAELADPVADGASAGERMRLRFTPAAGAAGEQDRLEGVLEVKPGGGGASRFVSLRLPRGRSLPRRGGATFPSRRFS